MAIRNPKSRPFSLRLSPKLDRFISDEARRTKRSKGAVAEALADEAMRCRRYPGIGFVGEDWNRRARVLGTGWDVWEIVQAIQDFGLTETAVAETGLPERAIRLAEAYYREYPEETDARIAENRRPLSHWKETYPTAGVIETSF